MSEQNNELTFSLARDYAPTIAFLNGLQFVLEKIGYRLTSSDTAHPGCGLRTFRLEPFLQPPRCDPKCDHESGTHEASPPAAEKVQTVVLWQGHVLLVEGNTYFGKNLPVDRKLWIPPGFVVKEIK